MTPSQFCNNKVGHIALFLQTTPHDISSMAKKASMMECPVGKALQFSDRARMDIREFVFMSGRDFLTKVDNLMTEMNFVHLPRTALSRRYIRPKQTDDHIVIEMCTREIGVLKNQRKLAEQRLENYRKQKEAIIESVCADSCNNRNDVGRTEATTGNRI